MIETIFNFDAKVAEWVVSQLPYIGSSAKFYPFRAIGIGDAEKRVLLGGAVYHNYRKHSADGAHDIEITLATVSPRWATKRIVRELLSYPFYQLQCGRVTCITGRKNKKARKLLKQLGFFEEGCIRRALDGREDAMVYGMLREECRWLEGEQDGQTKRPVIAAAA